MCQEQVSQRTLQIILFAVGKNQDAREADRELRLSLGWQLAQKSPRGDGDKVNRADYR